MDTSQSDFFLGGSTSERAQALFTRERPWFLENVRREVAEGRFRDDLLYRLRILEMDVPPLRERGDDIELLTQIFLESAARLP